MNASSEATPERSHTQLAEPYLAVKVMMMPRDTNPHGTIFGGVLLSYIDQAGAIGLTQNLQTTYGSAPLLVTVAMNEVEFHEPVFVGDVVSFWTEVVRRGRTSATVRVTVTKEVAGEKQQEPGVRPRVQLTRAEVTYVGVRDASVTGRRTPVRLFSKT